MMLNKKVSEIMTTGTHKIAKFRLYPCNIHYITKPLFCQYPFRKFFHFFFNSTFPLYNEQKENLSCLRAAEVFSV